MRLCETKEIRFSLFGQGITVGKKENEINALFHKHLEYMERITKALETGNLISANKSILDNGKSEGDKSRAYQTLINLSKE